ncbi:MAG: hypothetical protein CMJ89_00570 [Planctomycetes bacterium]|nr:hypothetical protein [Planctomycetota bacterium]
MDHESLGLPGWLGWLLVAGALSLSPRSAPGQDPATLSRLDALEKQRVLQHQLGEARADGDLHGAARLCAEIVRLEHLVPSPFTRGDPREDLATEARDFLSRHVKGVSVELENARAQALGKSCRRCSGRAFTRCRRCTGKGWRTVKAGRRTRRLDCRAWDPCEVCEASGRLAANPTVHDRLRRLVLLAGKEAVKTDVLASIRHVLENVDGVPPGLMLEDQKGGALRKLAGPAPVLPDRIRERGKLKSLWLNSLPEDRREFLYAYGLEAATVAHGLRFLEGLDDAPTPARVLKNAERISLGDLAWKGAAFVGKYVTVRATGKKPDAAFLSAVQFPLAGRIALEGVDPTMVLAYCYTPGDLEMVRVASKLGMLSRPDRSIRNYPPRVVLKKLEGIDVGTPLDLSGRLLQHPDGVPAVLFEVWHVRAAEQDGEGK